MESAFLNASGPGIVYTVIVFLAALSLLVFVHEWGHYIVARLFGVRVEVFSIGFGRELKGWTDSRGTRWKISLLPLGGYVRFFGDAGAASNPSEAVAAMPESERAASFHHKPIPVRAAIVAAGPAINLLFAVLIYAGIFLTGGQEISPPRVVEVLPETPAAAAGLESGDLILSVNGQNTDTRRDLVRLVSLYPGQTVSLSLERDGRTLSLTATPERRALKDRFGNEYVRGQLGIMLGGEPVVRSHGPASALGAAMSETVSTMRMMLVVVGQVVMGVRSVEELGGPVRIAKMTGEYASLGLLAFLQFLALISINLGLINLFPIPMLDGGHLLLYVFEAVKGSPLSMRAQEIGFMLGFTLIVSLMVLVTWNDLASL